MKRTLIRLGLAALVSSALFGCGGGSDGVSGASGTTTTVQVNAPSPQTTILTNSVTPSTAQAAAWQTLQPTITVTGVTINSPPVVKFSVTDANGNAVTGLANYSQASTAQFPSLTNLSFTLAKLVPATATAPSKWVSYLVTKPTTVAQAAGTVAATESCTADFKWCGTYPTADKEGTLVENSNLPGTYQYTFKRDIKQAASIIAGLTDSATGLKFKADLGDLSYDPTLTHRLGVIINGNAPGTGTNTPKATASTMAAVPMAIAGNVVYNFRPDGGAVTATRNVVDIASCASCHNGKGIGHGNSRRDPNLCVTCHTDQVKYGFNVESKRISPLVLDITTNTAVLDGRAVGNYPNMVHKLHMGNKLHLTGYDFNSNPIGQFNNVNWIQDPRDCTKCHNGTQPTAANPTPVNMAVYTVNGDNWKNNPSQLACGSCHDNISFAAVVPTGLTAHKGGAATDDSTCASCHAPSAAAVSPIDVDHRAETPTVNNPTVTTGISTMSYQIKSVAVDATTRVPSITFRILKDGVPVTTFATPTVAQNATTGVNAVSTTPAAFQAIPGFTGGPTFYIAYAVPQDGVTAPADFNTYASVSLTNLLVTSGHPKAGTLSAADANGYMTATLTGSSGQVVTTAPTTAIACPNVATSTAAGYCANPSLIKIPTNAQMATGIMLGNFTQVAFTTGDTATLTAKYNLTNGTVSKGLVIKTRLAKLEATGFAARRVAVQTSKCDACHEQLGTAVTIHSGDRNDPTACAMCHNTSRTSSAWAANVSTYIHALHAGTNTGVGGAGPLYSTGKRVIPFTWNATSATDNMSLTVYPGILKKCDNCHLPNTVNFGVNGTTLQPNLLWTTTAASVLTDDSAAANPKLPHDTASPKNPVYTGLAIGGSKNFGNVMSYTPEGSVVPRVQTSATGTVYNANALTIAGAGGVTVASDLNTLVESPITAACFSCHDSVTAQGHMTSNGGVIYGTRAANGGATLPSNKEGCLTCHGYGRPQDAAVVHAQ